MSNARRSKQLKYQAHLRLWTERVIVLSMGTSAKANVPCGACQQCCINSEVDVDYEVRAGIKYRVQTKKNQYGRFILRKRANGACVYLGDNGCTLENSKKPGVCRAYDCRDTYWHPGIPLDNPVWAIIEKHKESLQCLT